MRVRVVLLALGGLALGCATHGTREEASSPRLVKVPNAEGEDSTRAASPRAVAQVGHRGEIWAIAWSPDGQRVATGSFDHTIRIWSEHGRLLAVLAGHREAIVDLEWSPKGDVLGSTARDATTRLWDLRHAGKYKKLEKTGDHLAFSPTGDRVALVGFDLVVQVFDTKSGARTQTFVAAQGRQLRAVAWSSDGKRIAASALDGPLYVWDAESGDMLTQNATGGGGALQELCFSPDARWLASAGSRFSLFDTTTGQTRQLSRNGVNPYDATFSSDGKKLVTNGSMGHVHVWDVASAKYERSFSHPGYVAAVAARPKSSLVAIGGKVPFRSPDGNVEIPITRIYDLESGKQTAHLEGTARPVERASWSPAGDTLLTESPELVTWNAYTGERRQVLYPGGFGADWNPKLPLVAVTGRETVRVVDTKTAKLVATIRQEEPSATWSPDGATLAVRSFDALVLWDVASKKTTPLIAYKRTGIWDVAFTPDSTQLAIASSKGIDAYGVKSGKLEMSYPLKGRVRPWSNAEQLVFGPSGTLVATLNGTGMVLFDRDGRFMDLVEDRTRFALPGFTPDGGRLAYAAKDDIRIHGARDRTVYAGHDHVVRSVAWSPDGARFASSSDDQTVRLWKPGRAQPLRTFATYDGRVWSVRWHPSGKALLGVGNEAMIHLLAGGETLRMVTSPGASGAAWFTDSGEYAGDARALQMVVLRKTDDLLDPEVLADGGAWKHRPELLAGIAR
jgi:WD40 repeat protein